MINFFFKFLSFFFMSASGVCVLHIFYVIVGKDLSSFISWSDALSYSSSKYVVRVKENIFFKWNALALKQAE